MPERNRNQVLLGVLNALADGVRDFGCLANAPDMAIVVTNDDQRGKPEVASAFDGLDDAVDGN